MRNMNNQENQIVGWNIERVSNIDSIGLIFMGTLADPVT
jgi:hypothetical protein